jgi:NTE family protein
MRASISIPLLFEPVEWNEKYLVDGGITEAVPTQTVREMGVNKVIAVNLYAGDFQEELNLDKKKVIEIARRSMSIALEEIARRDLQLADISLNPMIGNIPLSTIGEDPTPYIQIGEEVVKSHLKEIKKL